MSKWYRKVSVFLVVAMLILAGCGGQPAKQESTPVQPAQPPEQPKAPAPVALNVWIMPNSGKPDADLLDVLKPFTDKNKHITVNVTVLDWGSAWTKITAAAASGEGPDVLQLGTTWVPAIAAMNALEPLTAKVGEVGGKDNYFAASWNTTGIAGKPDTYAVPWFIDARAAFYRTDVFRKAGVDPAEAFKNWDSFKNALKKINGTEMDGKKVAAIGFPGKNDWNVAHNIFPWIWAAGGSELSTDLKTAGFNSDAGVDGMMFYTGLVRDGLVPKATLEKNTAEVEAMFTNGDFAVLFAGPWLISGYSRSKDQGGNAESVTAKNYAVAPIAEGPKGRFTFFGGSNLAIFKSSKHKNEAWELVKHLSGKEAQLAYAKHSGMLPAVKAVEAEFKAVNPNYAAFYEAAKYGRSYPALPAWGPIEGAIVKHIGTIWDMTAGTAGSYSRDSIKKQLDEAAKEVNNLLKQGQ